MLTATKIVVFGTPVDRFWYFDVMILHATQLDNQNSFHTYTSIHISIDASHPPADTITVIKDK